MNRLLLFVLLFFVCAESYGQVQRDTSYAKCINSERQVFTDRFGNEVGWFDFSEPAIGRKIWINSLEKYIYFNHSLLIPDLKNQRIVTFSLKANGSCTSQYHQYLFIYNFSGEKIFESESPLFDDVMPRALFSTDGGIYISGVDFESKNLVLKKLNLDGEIIWEQVVIEERRRATDLFISEDERFIGVVSDSQYPILVLFSESGEKIIEKELNDREKSCYDFHFFDENRIIASWCWRQEQLVMNPLIFKFDESEKAINSGSEIYLTKYIDKHLSVCHPIPNTNKFAVVNLQESKVSIFELKEDLELRLVSEVLLNSGLDRFMSTLGFFEGKGVLYSGDRVYEFKY